MRFLSTYVMNVIWLTILELHWYLQKRFHHCFINNKWDHKSLTILKNVIVVNRSNTSNIIFRRKGTHNLYFNIFMSPLKGHRLIPTQKVIIYFIIVSIFEWLLSTVCMLILLLCKIRIVVPYWDRWSGLTSILYWKFVLNTDRLLQQWYKFNWAVLFHVIDYIY